MNELKFNSQVCTTKEQSQRLLDLGLKPETADCQYAALVIDWKGNPISNPKWRFYNHNEGFIVQNFEQMECVPAWSLHRLMEIGNFVNVGFLEIEKMYECCIQMLEGQIKGGIINKEYLEEQL